MIFISLANEVSLEKPVPPLLIEMRRRFKLSGPRLKATYQTSSWDTCESKVDRRVAATSVLHAHRFDDPGSRYNAEHANYVIDRWSKGSQRNFLSDVNTTEWRGGDRHARTCRSWGKLPSIHVTWQRFRHICASSSRHRRGGSRSIYRAAAGGRPRRCEASM